MSWAVDDTSILFFFVILFSSGMSSATTYETTSSSHMCDMDWCVERTSLSIRNFGKRFYGCQHWSPVSITWFFWFVFMIFLIIIMKTVIAFIYNIHSLEPYKTSIVSNTPWTFLKIQIYIPILSWYTTNSLIMKEENLT